MVEVTEKPVDLFGRVDNRGTKARGPLEFMTSATSNNLLHVHDALTVTYAGAFKTQELQYLGINYRQVLNGEGLALFVTGSDGWGDRARRSCNCCGIGPRAPISKPGSASR